MGARAQSGPLRVGGGGRLAAVDYASAHADDMSPLDADRVEHTQHVAREEQQVVRVDLGRLVGAAVPPEIGDDRPEPCVDECRDLVAPQPAGVGEPQPALPAARLSTARWRSAPALR